MNRSEEKRFPIQRCGSVPWSAAEHAYKGYVEAGHGGQSLERLAERGGFGAGEFAVLYQGWPYNDARFEDRWTRAIVLTAREMGDDWHVETGRGMSAKTHGEEPVTGPIGTHPKEDDV